MRVKMYDIVQTPIWYLGVVHDNIVSGRIDNVRLVKVVNARAHVALEAENVPQRQRRHWGGAGVSIRIPCSQSELGLREPTMTQMGKTTSRQRERIEEHKPAAARAGWHA